MPRTRKDSGAFCAFGRPRAWVGWCMYLHVVGGGLGPRWRTLLGHACPRPRAGPRARSSSTRTRPGSGCAVRRLAPGRRPAWRCGRGRVPQVPQVPPLLYSIEYVFKDFSLWRRKVGTGRHYRHSLRPQRHPRASMRNQRCPQERRFATTRVASPHRPSVLENCL